MVDMTQAGMRLRQEGEVPKRVGKGKGTLAGCESAVIVTHRHQRVGHPGGDPSQPRLVANGCSKRFRFAQVNEGLSVLSERKEGIVEVEPQIDGLLLCLAPVREILEGD